MKSAYVSWMEKVLLSVVLVFSGLGISCDAGAKTASAPIASGDKATEVAPERPSLRAAALQSFMPEPKPLMLRGVNGQEELALPIAPRLRIERAVLHLQATNSTALLAGRSQLQVRLNGRIVAQIGLQGDLPQIQARIELPVHLLKPGYNTLTFAAAQHYTNDCEDPSAPELWTQIDTARSWISLQGGLASWQPSLSQLGDVFDPKLWGKPVLTVLEPGPVDANLLRWGALAAQAAALRLGYAPLAVRALPVQTAMGAPDSPLRFETQGIAGDAVLAGTVDQLRPVLAPALLDRITGPFLAVLPLDAASTRFVVIASGRRAAEVDTALQALTLLNYPYPQTTQARVDAIELPTLPRYPGPNQLYPNQSVDFAALGLRTISFEGMYGRAKLEFSLPPDLFAPDNALVRLHLRFAYGAGLREDSVLNLLLNGRFQAAIALNARNGGYFQDYEVSIPLTSFRPGPNTLEFQAAMMPLVTGRCIAVNTENLRLTLYGNSRIELPNAAHVASLPDLNLLERTGFPYTTVPYGADRVIALTARDPDTLGAAWTLAAKLAQIQKLPLLQLHWQWGTDDLGRHGHDAIVVGPAATLPPAIAQALPLRLGARSIAPYPADVRPGGPGEIGWLSQSWRWLASKLRIRETPPPQPQTSWVTQDGIGLGEQGALMQARLPGGSGALTVLTAAQAQTLLRQTHDLVDPGVWGGLRGDVVLWQGQTQLASQMAGPTFTVGSAQLSSRIGFILSRHPGFWGVLLTVLLLALSALTLRLLMRYKHRRHGHVQDPPDSDDRPAS